MPFGVCQGEVVHPASDHRAQSFQDFSHGSTTATAGFLAYSALDAFQASAGYAYSHPACPSIVVAEAQELFPYCQVYCALGLVDLQAHTSLYETPCAFQHSLCRSFAFYIDVAIICIAHEAVSSFFQLAIQLCHYDV